MPIRQIIENVLCIVTVAGAFAFFAWLIGGPAAAVVAACAVIAMTGLSQMAAGQSDHKSNRVGRRHGSRR